MHSFEVHSNESAYRKSGRLGLEQVHGKEVLDGINDIDKWYIYQLMSNVQLPG